LCCKGRPISKLPGLLPWIIGGGEEGEEGNDGMME